LKILIFYEYFSPAKKSGGISRSLVNLSLFLAKNNEVYIFTGSRDMGDKICLPVKTNSWVLFFENINIWYAQKEYEKLSGVKKIIREIQPDVIYVNGMFNLIFSVFPLMDRIINKSKIRYVIAPRGMLQEGALSQKPLKKNLFLSFFKTFGLYNNIVWHVTDKQEGDDVSKINFQNAEIILASNIPAQSVKNLTPSFKKLNSVKLIYLSLITEKKNLLLAIEVLKTIPNQMHVQFDIYGPIKDEPYWNKCKEQIALLPKNVITDYKGPVSPDDSQAILSQYDLFFLPTKGENFGHAIFESLSVGTPVLISDKTPWRYLEEVGAGWDLSLNQLNNFNRVLTDVCLLDNDKYLKNRTRAVKLANEFIEKSDFKKQYSELFK
jgi:glycosyltransferase involved in cell wall biosynthesis